MRLLVEAQQCGLRGEGQELYTAARAELLGYDDIAERAGNTVFNQLAAYLDGDEDHEGAIDATDDP